jgi:class 3 adenylate cyclase
MAPNCDCAYSGAVIAGEIGSGALGFTAIGEQVGIAQRMESASPLVRSQSAGDSQAIVDG